MYRPPPKKKTTGKQAPLWCADSISLEYHFRNGLAVLQMSHLFMAGVEFLYLQNMSTSSKMLLSFQNEKRIAITTAKQLQRIRNLCHLHVIKCFDLTCSSRTTLKILCILANEVMAAPEVCKQLGGFPTELPVHSTTSCQSQQLLSPRDSQSLFSTFFCQVSNSNLSCLGDNISPIS